MPPVRRHADRSHARHVHHDQDLVDAAAAVERDIELAARSEDVAAGLLPVWATRSLHPHELAARVSFAAIDTAQVAAGGGLGRRLEEDRARMLVLLESDLSRLATGRAVVDRLIELEVAGLVSVEGAVALVNATQADVRAALATQTEVAQAMVAAEAAEQGLRLAGGLVLDEAQLGQLDQLANRLAVAPHVDLIRALREEAIRVATPATADLLVPALVEHGRALSTKPLEEYARTAVAQADGLGRQGAVAVESPAQIYASELLDGNTCGPCSFIDGEPFATIAEARAAYPNGTYVNCEGGLRCRGTLVYVWNVEAPATVER